MAAIRKLKYFYPDQEGLFIREIKEYMFDHILLIPSGEIKIALYFASIYAGENDTAEVNLVHHSRTQPFNVKERHIQRCKFDDNTKILCVFIV